MINYKQILEAVNRGIKFALDDFEDQDDIQGQTNSKVKYQDGTKEWLDLMNEVVDLGLPSGTLWCKYNLDVDPNQLTKAEDWHGNYYAWGELVPNKTNEDGKIYFKWYNYKFGNDFNKLTKYCSDSDYGLNGFTDNLTKLLPEDDAAYQNKKLHNFKFRIPTIEQFNELIKYTKNYWVNNYDPDKLVHNPKDDGGIQGLNGRIFKGKTGNQLFIPASGIRYGSNNANVSSDCYMWTSSFDYDYPYGAYYLYFYLGNVDIGYNDRCDGLSVRPVIKL